MIQFLQFVYSTFLLPPGIFIVMLVIYCAVVYRRRRKPPFVLIIFTILFYLCSTQWFGNMLIRPLEARYVPPADIRGDVIIMLGGGALPDVAAVHGAGQLSGHAANRLLTAAHLQRKLGLPVLVSGGQVYPDSGREAVVAKSILLGLGVPEEQIIVEDQSRNTTENAAYSKVLLERHGFREPILVTSAFHMERAVRQFDKAGVRVRAYPADYQANVVTVFTFSQLRPNAGALQSVSLAAKEYVGLLVSRWY